MLFTFSHDSLFNHSHVKDNIRNTRGCNRYLTTLNYSNKHTHTHTHNNNNNDKQTPLIHKKKNLARTTPTKNAIAHENTIALALSKFREWFHFNCKQYTLVWQDTTTLFSGTVSILAPGEVRPGHMMLAPLSTNLMAPLST